MDRPKERRDADHPDPPRRHIWASPGVASGLYDYIQRNIWTTNDGFVKFLYHSPVASALAQLGGARESVRVTTDLLMVNPNKGFKWHQDNQNGPVAFDNALRWWVTMDDSPKDYGAPVYLKKSQLNKCVPEDAVFVDIDEGDLPEYHDFTTFRPKAGDLIVWHARTIHKIDGPTSQDWGSVKRRVLGGTVAIDDATYARRPSGRVFCFKRTAPRPFPTTPPRTPPRIAAAHRRRPSLVADAAASLCVGPHRSCKRPSAKRRLTVSSRSTSWPRSRSSSTWSSSSS